MTNALQALLSREYRPPLPDSSTPLGAMAADTQSVMDRRLEELSCQMREQLARVASGDPGKGPSAAEVCRNQPLLSELEAHLAQRKAT
jgi:hypothetical protein